MKKELFGLRHAALAAALALAMGAPPAFADEVALELPTDEPAVAPAPVDEPVVIGEPEVGSEPTPIDEPVAVETPETIEDPSVIDEPVTLDDPLPGDGEVIAEEPLPDDAVTLAPGDDCGMICWNTAGLPPEAVQKEITEPEIMQFGVSGETPEPSLNVSAELSGAVGAAEQLGAADVALEDTAGIAPLAATTPAAAVVATASEGRVNVIRDGHLR